MKDYLPVPHPSIIVGGNLSLSSSFRVPRLAKQPPSPADGGFHCTLFGCPRQTLLKHIIIAQAEGYLHSAIDVSVTAPAAASITLQRRSIIQSQRAGTVTIKSAGTIEGP